MSETADPVAPLPSTVSVRFRHAGPVYSYVCGSLSLRPGDQVVVETERGTALGIVAAVPGPLPPPSDGRRLRVIKRADARDLTRQDTQLQRARDAQRIALHRIRERQIAMKLIEVESQLDAGKFVFYFSAAGRVDFRDLVRDLAQTLHCRVEMKQIGARDETKLTGGVGPCGRELCCSSWMTEFQPVSLNMAKAQGLSLNPSKLAGMCGRLKCCLRYEYDTYRELGRNLPGVGSAVVCVKGDGVVTRQNVLRQTVLVRREDGTEVEATLDDLVQRKPE
ncbi:MAG TPA: regulatory iron-sulfur-containing complex subunit RicT [Candidatus Kryptonia bacterium]|nr:regulatory iron-sulfur-containing complex subunit RicT [Candidatus Kryptonia bacterium]